MFTVEYTHEWFPYSTAVDGLYFNSNTNTLVVDWDDALYAYEGVTLVEAERVATARDAGGSVGARAAELKAAKGPGTLLGDFNDAEFDEVDERVSVGVPKDLKYDAQTTPINDRTKEYSLGAPPVQVVNNYSTYAAPVVEPTKEFSLQTPEPLDESTYEDIDGAVSVTVVFDLDGLGKDYTFKATAINVEDALEELNDYVGRINATGKVRQVVVDFE